MSEHTRRTVLRGAAGVGVALGAAVAGGQTVGAGSAAAASGRGGDGRPAQARRPSPEHAQRPFLEGAFAPVTEEVTAYDLPVVGRLPRELSGRYLRTGPNALGLEDPMAHHWMLGDGMVHGVRLREGRAEWYRNRWVRSRAVAQKLGEPYPWPEPPADFAANTHVICHRGRVLALQESGPLPYELDEELRTRGPYDFGGTLRGAFTAHTKYDAWAGELHAVAYDPTWGFLRHLVIDGSGRVVRTTDVPVPDSPVVHDFALTERHVVFFDMPLTFDAGAAARGEPVPYVWNERHRTRVGVLPRAGGPVRWFEVDPVYYSHTLGAYDDGHRVVVDVTSMPAPFHAAGRGLGGPAASGPPTLNRWTIDLAGGRVRIRPLDDRPQEFPRLREGLMTRPYRYAYTAFAAELWSAYGALDGVPPDHAFGNALIKQDLLRGTSEVHRFPRGAAVSEPVFVPRAADGDELADRGAPEGVGGPVGVRWSGRAGRWREDDGYVLAFVHDPHRGATDLVVLAGQDFTAAPLARVQLPVRVPLGFHGSWVPDGGAAWDGPGGREEPAESGGQAGPAGGDGRGDSASG